MEATTILTRGAARSDVLLVLMSPAWLQSEWCRREFSTFTDDATDAARLHRILPVLWVDTPELNPRSLDLVARTMANISYADWRDLRYESWEESKNQRQIGKLAESAISLIQSRVGEVEQPTTQPAPPAIATERLPEEKEKLLLALNAAPDGLTEDRVARNILRVSSTNGIRPSAFRLGGCWRLNARICRTRLFPRRLALRISSRDSKVGCCASRSCFANSTLPRITPKMLLKS